MINPMDLSGKTIIVTGASSGIGRETCICLSQLGARVVLVARNKEKLAQTASCLEGGGHFIEPFDLSLVDEVPTWFEKLTGICGPVDGVVHSAGTSMYQPVKMWSFSDTDRIMRINLYACFALAKGMRKGKAHNPGSSLVLVSSTAGIQGYGGLAVYSASKAAIIGITRTLAVELARDGLRVNCVAPGMVETEMLDATGKVLTEEQIESIAKSHPLGFGKPRDVANAIAFLLADTSRWITGITLVTDGGRTC